MNIDGLHRQLPALLPLFSATSSPERPREGVTLEMHGCCLDVVCEACAAVAPLAPPLRKAFRAAAAAAGGGGGRGGAAAAAGPRGSAAVALPEASDAPAALARCGGALRPRVMLYDDPAEALITPPFDAALAADLAIADAVLWVGISFEQSASVEHFRRARRALQAAGRAGAVPQLVVNPCAEAAFNVETAVANACELRLLRVHATADAFLSAIAEGLPAAPGGGGAAAAPGARRKRTKRAKRADGAGAAAADEP